MFILKKGHQPGVYVPLRALFLVPEETKSSNLKKTFFFADAKIKAQISCGVTVQLISAFVFAT